MPWRAAELAAWRGVSWPISTRLTPAASKSLPGAVQLDRVRLADRFSRSGAARRARPGARSTGRRAGRSCAVLVGQARSRRARPHVGGCAAGVLRRRRACCGEGYYGILVGDDRGRARGPVDAVGGADRARDDHALSARGSAETRGLEFEDYHDAVAVVGRRPRGVLELDRRVLRRSLRRCRRSGCWARRRCPARSGSRARGSATPSTSSRGKDPDAVAIRHASELRELDRVDVGRAARRRRPRSPRGCARSASARATASRRTCRTSPRRSRRCSRARRSARCGPRPRPSSARGA